MPLNYSKWDMLELSDDSDIEEHPNVDKKSMIRWKQRDIHEKREQKKLELSKLNSELSLNSVLRPRIKIISEGVSSKGVDYFRSVQRRIKEDPSPDKPNTGAANQPTYDMMMGQLLGDVWKEATLIVDGALKVDPKTGFAIDPKGDGSKVNDQVPEPNWAVGVVPDNKKEDLTKALVERLDWHISELDRRDKEVKKEIEDMEKEQKKKITSDDIRDGWSQSSVVAPKPSPLEDKPKPGPKKEKKTTVETIEVLNPGAGSSSQGASAPAPVPSTAAADAASDPEADDDIPDISPLNASSRAFAQIPIGDFERSYAFIQKDSSVLSEEVHDSLLAEAFDAERRGDKALAQRCVHQSLLVNYCRQLGRDGVGLFFQKMITKNPKSITMFNQDFQNTYNRIASRTVELMAEEEAMGEREQIQLVSQDEGTKIGFNLPDGPPPAELRLEGEGTENLDIEEVKKFLQRKWDIFQGFPEKFQTALRTEQLDEVNKVLGRMKVSEAEEVVELLQEGGMLSFSESGVRDMTQ